MLSVDVKPIPEDYDAPYWLPAKKIELREDWPDDLDNLVAGEPVTRGLTLVAEGLTAAQLPEFALPHIDGIKQYPDQPLLEDRRAARGITGTREQKVALIPGSEGRYQIPEIRVPWWNVESGRMETAVLPARVLNVAAAAVAPVLPQSTLPATEESVATPPPQTSRFWLWLSLVLALGWAASAVYWWYRTRRERTSTAEFDEHPSLRQARQRLRQACGDNNPADARSALLDWGRALLAPQPVAHLQQLAQRLGVDMAGEIARLNQSLYAPAHSDWQGESLWRLCERLESRDKSTLAASGDDLLPLNPPG